MPGRNITYSVTQPLTTSQPVYYNRERNDFAVNALLAFPGAWADSVENYGDRLTGQAASLARGLGASDASTQAYIDTKIAAKKRSGKWSHLQDAASIASLLPAAAMVGPSLLNAAHKLLTAGPQVGPYATGARALQRVLALSQARKMAGSVSDTIDVVQGDDIWSRLADGRATEAERLAALEQVRGRESPVKTAARAVLKALDEFSVSGESLGGVTSSEAARLGMLGNAADAFGAVAGVANAYRMQEFVGDNPRSGWNLTRNVGANIIEAGAGVAGRVLAKGPVAGPIAGWFGGFVQQALNDVAAPISEEQLEAIREKLLGYVPSDPGNPR